MFTGLVEDMGRVVAINQKGAETYFTLASPLISADLAIGDSVAVNGACLTVVQKEATRFSVAAMAETLRRTNLGRLRLSDHVNLERALRLSDRLGGHLVLGHVDGLGEISDLSREGEALIMTIKPPAELLHLLVPKGSITVDGISLTIADLFADSFSISLIPHTLGVTTLDERRLGDAVNLEGDIIGKYVARLLSFSAQSQNQPSSRDLSMELLRNHGFAE